MISNKLLILIVSLAMSSARLVLVETNDLETGSNKEAQPFLPRKRSGSSLGQETIGLVKDPLLRKNCQYKWPVCGRDGVTYSDYCQTEKKNILCKGKCPCTGCFVKNEGDVCDTKHGPNTGFCKRYRCILNRASDTCKTVSGPKPNHPCHFPFYWIGKKHNSCAYEGYSKPWCSTKTTDSGRHVRGNWGNCDVTKCHIPRASCGVEHDCYSSLCKSKKECEAEGKCKWRGNRSCQSTSCFTDFTEEEGRQVEHGAKWKCECGTCRCNEGRVSSDKDNTSTLLGKTLAEARSMISDMVICENGVRMGEIEGPDNRSFTDLEVPARLNVDTKNGKIVKIYGSG